MALCCIRQWLLRLTVSSPGDWCGRLRHGRWLGCRLRDDRRHLSRLPGFKRNGSRFRSQQPGRNRRADDRKQYHSPLQPDVPFPLCGSVPDDAGSGQGCSRWCRRRPQASRTFRRPVRSRRTRRGTGSMARQMTLVGFLQAQNCTNFVGSWRHPLADQDFTSAEYYRRIGRALEAGKFHLGFFDDRLAMPDLFGGDHAHTVANGIRCVKMDPITILTVMGMATERLGLGSTFSTTYFEPFHVARVFATLDLMTGGRAAWNVVTSMNDGEAHNMGHAAHRRSRRAVTTAPTSSWKSSWATGTRGRTARSSPTARPDCSRIPTKCIGWTIKGEVFPVARPVHRAAIGAGPSGHHPGWSIRPRHDLRRAVGGVRVRRLSRHRAGEARLRRVQRQGRGSGQGPGKSPRLRRAFIPSSRKPAPRPRTRSR